MSKGTDRAIELYRQFRGHDPEFLDTVETKDYREYLVIGYLNGVLYETERDGELENYIHNFDEESRPLLCVSHDGEQLIILGGDYQFTERGIIG